MANNRIQVKRTSVSGRTPNTTNSGNGQFIDSGEFALNLADGILYSSNGSLIPIGANNVDVNVTGNLTLNAIIANGYIGTPGQVLTTNGGGVYWSTVTGGGGGSVDPDAQYYWTNTQTFSNTITFNKQINIGSNVSLNTSAISVGNSTVNTQILPGNVTLHGSSITVVNSTAQMTINDSGYTITDISTGSNTVANSSSIVIDGRYVLTSSQAGVANDSLYLGGIAAANYQTIAGLSANVAILAANSATYLGGNTASDLRTYASDKAANAYSNATTYASNASNISSGTLDYARLGANVVNTSANFTFTGQHTYNANIVLNASLVDSTGNTGSNGQILTTNGANTYWSSKYTVGALPPDYPNYGDTWYYTDMEKLFMWINDGGSDYWYDFLPPN